MTVLNEVFLVNIQVAPLRIRLSSRRYLARAYIGNSFQGSESS